MSTIFADRLVENYYRFMKYWDADSKKNIIRKLSASIVLNNTKSDFSSCFGAWYDSIIADDIIEDAWVK